MHPVFSYTRPGEIEARSMELIRAELGPHSFTPAQLPLALRVIHATADFSFKESLYFSPGSVESGLAALGAGATLVTDTNMALAGISKPSLKALGCKALCFMADPQVAQAARSRGVTRAAVSMEKAAALPGPLILALGNAPTALIRLCELMEQDETFRPALILGVPVGFVNVVESKELLEDTCRRLGVPCILARGRKGGSTVAAALCNALLYTAVPRQGM
ncbi:precorrin-8X methylmutase [Fournierella massiliensis]|nr:precorrin-8X methylmutase [Fournierella massiliensis]MCF2558116.1 precorrin-8X methylmutase [Fournierella massiliensis]